MKNPELVPVYYPFEIAWFRLEGIRRVKITPAGRHGDGMPRVRMRLDAVAAREALWRRWPEPGRRAMKRPTIGTVYAVYWPTEQVLTVGIMWRDSRIRHMVDTGGEALMMMRNSPA
ncbi:hypothetical protein [Microbacterium sp.]|uniref:hypothetical protein n=1 Tax=Microbacterium sp. TaxID=51671 RepID=UPI003A94A950